MQANIERKMKLTELLNRITPLPWHSTTMPDTGEPATAILGGDGIRIATVDVLTPPVKAISNQRYFVHAANVLPELLAAAKNLQNNWEHNLTEPMARLNEAIAIADDVDNPGLDD